MSGLANAVVIDLKRMAKKTGLDPEKIKGILGTSVEYQTPLPKQLKTVRDAIALYHDSLEGSNARTFALQQWNRLALIELRKIDQAGRLKVAYSEAPEGSEAKQAAWEKWNRCSVVEAQAAKTLDQACSAYYHSPKNSQAQKIAQQRWEGFGLTEVEATSQLAALDKIFHRCASQAPQAAKAAVTKWNQIVLAQIVSTSDLRELERLYRGSLVSEETKSTCLEKYFLLAVTFNHHSWLYFQYPSGSERRQFCFQKCLELVADTGEAWGFYKNLYDSSHKASLYPKWLVLAAAKLSQDVSLQDVIYTYSFSPKDSEVRKQALEKAIGLATFAKAARELIQYTQSTPEDQKLVVQRVAPLFRGK